MEIIRQLHEKGYTMSELVITLKIPRSSLARNMTTSLVEDAFRKSLKRRGFDKCSGLIVQSDRGSQYSSQSFRRMLKEASRLQSKNPRGDCYANTHA